MTSWEIFRYLTNPARIEDQHQSSGVSFGVVRKSLEGMMAKDIIYEKEGFYYFKKDSAKRVFPEKRDGQDKLSDLKIKKVTKITRWLQIFPFIRGIFLSGSLVFGWAEEQSDVDLLIITQKNHLWTTRFLLSGLLTLLGLKRSRVRIKNRLCLNHFITDHNPKISLYSLYNAETYARLIPLCIEDKTLVDFLMANRWINDYILWGSGRYYQDIRRMPMVLWKKTLRSLFELLLIVLGGGVVLEKILRRWQIRHIKKDPLIYKKGGRVVADMSQIEFHPDSPEKQHLESYNRQLISLKLFSSEPEHDSGLTR